MLSACLGLRRVMDFPQKGMITLLLLLKILVSVAAVVMLSVVAERVSTRVAGVLSGFPLGTAITLFFIGLEQGTDFVAQSAFHTCIGFAATLVLIWTWYQVTVRVNSYQVLWSVVLSTFMFLVAATILTFIPANILTALLVPGAAIFLAMNLMSSIRNVKVEGKVSSSWLALMLRAILAALIVVLITGLADILGPTRAGLLSAFPVTVFPLLLIMHLTYGRAPLNTVIKNYPYGLGSLVVYAFSVHWTYPALGVYFGTVVSLMLATAYIVFYYQLTRKSEGLL